MKHIFATLGLVAAPLGASAATLNFDGMICNGGNACSNGLQVDQSYGDIAGEIDVEYDANRGTMALDNVFHWNNNYESLTNIIYGVNGGGGMSIKLLAQAGFDVLLSGFDIAPYANRSRDTLVQIVDMATGALLVDDTYAPLTTTGPTSYAGVWESTVGIQINLGPDAWDVGIDNIEYASVAETTAAVPLPATGLLLIGGLFGASRLRRKS
jgi:hypothetical protein